MFIKTLVSTSIITVCVGMSFGAQANDNEKGSSEPDRLLEDWKFKVGADVVYAPDYEGSNDYEAGIMPDVEIIWNDRVSLSMDGLMIDALQSENLTLGFGLGMTDSRDASDNKALKGLGDIDASVAGVLYGSYMYEFVEFSAAYSQDLGDGHEGSTLGIEANLMVPIIEDKLMIMVGPDVTWASDDYMQSYYGISSKQAANSNYSTYDADSGFKNIGLHALAEYRFTDSISFNVMAQYSKVIGDAADSPLVKNEGSDNQFHVGTMLSYSF